MVEPIPPSELEKLRNRYKTLSDSRPSKLRQKYPYTQRLSRFLYGFFKYLTDDIGIKEKGKKGKPSKEHLHIILETILFANISIDVEAKRVGKKDKGYVYLPLKEYKKSINDDLEFEGSMKNLIGHWITRGKEIYAESFSELKAGKYTSEIKTPNGKTKFVDYPYNL